MTTPFDACLAKIEKLALRGKKQLLEKIGVTARTTKKAAQRVAPKKVAATRAAKKA
jgi:predicted pyridoxine 5'-phosphate oxidase superfamily flavin-nucleotide-binding protein